MLYERARDKEGQFVPAPILVGSIVTDLEHHLACLFELPLTQQQYGERSLGAIFVHAALHVTSCSVENKKV